MISRRIRLAAGIAAACLLSSGVAVAADEDTKEEKPLPVSEENLKKVWDQEDQTVSEEQAEALREQAENREVKPKESWISGMSTGHEPAPLEEEEKAQDKKDDKDDE